MKKTVKVLSAVLASCILFGVFITGAFATADDDDIVGGWEVGLECGYQMYVDDQTGVVTLALENFDALAGKLTMIIAEYDANGKIISVTSKTEVADLTNTMTAPVDEKAETIKGFILDAFSGIPVCDDAVCIKTDD
ncbi:MAG: hypothetical protein IJS65_00035 [Clostridia bacterium]|nr:hypothetical protein [Clostridia bacterium]